VHRPRATKENQRDAQQPAKNRRSLDRSAQNEGREPTPRLLAIQRAGFGGPHALQQKDEKWIVLHGHGFQRRKRIFWRFDRVESLGGEKLPPEPLPHDFVEPRQNSSRKCFNNIVA